MSQIPEKAWRAGRFWWDSSRPGEPGAQPLRAMVFDLDALTDVEGGGHRVAYNAAFAVHGLNVVWSTARYRRLLALPDERQRVAAELRARGVGAECDVLLRILVDEICSTKAMMVDEVVLGADLDARTGLVELITDGFTADVPVAVVSTGRRQWVEPLVRQLVGDGLVQTIVTADDVGIQTLGAETFRMALAELGAPARDSLMFSGSHVGVRSAMSVGLAGVLVDPDVPGARGDYDGLRLAGCQRLQSDLWVRGNRSAAA